MNARELADRVRILEEENRRLRQQNAELLDDQRITTILLSKSDAIASETDLDRLLMIINDETRELLEAERCTVFVLDEKGELWSRVGTGIETSEIRLPTTAGIVGYVATAGETVNIPDAYQDPRFNPDIDKATGFRTRSLLCMPMRNRDGGTIGVVQVLNKIGPEGQFDEKDVKLLGILSTSAANAIERAQLYDELQRMFDSIVETLAATIDARDPITAGHSKRVTVYCTEIGRRLGFSKGELELLRYAALLHDYGKIGVRESLLTKEGKLDEEEYRHVQKHVTVSRQILQRVYFLKTLRGIPEIAASHHERVDGSGYPDHLQGNNIPLMGRIMGLADVFDALTSKRHYRDPMPIDRVLDIIYKGRNRHFDPSVVDAFLELPVAAIISVIHFDDVGQLPPEDADRLSQYSMGEFRAAVSKSDSERSPEEGRMIELFSSYYNHCWRSPPPP